MYLALLEIEKHKLMKEINEKIETIQRLIGKEEDHLASIRAGELELLLLEKKNLRLQLYKEYEEQREKERRR